MACSTHVIEDLSIQEFYYLQDPEVDGSIILK
jgi:hypothetical protein